MHIKVPAEKRRDHLALERTFLGYLRTSLAMSMVAVIIAQLFRLQASPLPGGGFGYFVLGVPLAACFIGGSIVVVLLGALRFWRQQTAMVKGKVWAGGFEVLWIMGIGILVSYPIQKLRQVVCHAEADREYVGQLCLATFIVILIAKDPLD